MLLCDCQSFLLKKVTYLLALHYGTGVIHDGDDDGMIMIMLYSASLLQPSGTNFVTPSNLGHKSWTVCTRAEDLTVQAGLLVGSTYVNILRAVNKNGLTDWLTDIINFGIVQASTKEKYG